MTAVEIGAALRAGAPVSDARFDALLPAAHRARAPVHATPIAVALQVSALLAPAPGGEILDVGCGTGKMCLVGALTAAPRWTGVDQHAGMVRIAARLARELGLAARTAFIHARAETLDWRPFGGVYLYNPLAEAVFAERDPDRAEIGHDAEVRALEAALATLRDGARVVTYFGFGGELPPGFELEEALPIGGDSLCLWIKR